MAEKIPNQAVPTREHSDEFSCGTCGHQFKAEDNKTGADNPNCPGCNNGEPKPVQRAGRPVC